MAIQKITNSVLYGLAADTKPTNYATNTILMEQDTGNIYRYNGASWDLFRGAAKAETLSNKTVDAVNQTDIKRMIVADAVRETGMAYANPAGVGTWGWLLGMTFLGASAALQTVDSSHGLSSLFTSTAIANSSVVGERSANTFTYRQWSPYFRLKFSLPTTTNNRVFIGFRGSTASDGFTADTMLSAGSEGGVGIGWRSTDTNWMVFNNVSGSGTMTATSTGVAKDTGVHSVEIIADESVPNWVVKRDGTTMATLTTNIPAATAALCINFSLTISTAVAQTFKLYNAWFEHKRTVAPL